jgi:hypothetical protein
LDDIIAVGKKFRSALPNGSTFQLDEGFLLGGTKP